MEDIYGFFLMLDFLAPFALLGGIAYILAEKYRAKNKQAVQ